MVYDMNVIDAIYRSEGKWKNVSFIKKVCFLFLAKLLCGVVLVEGLI